MILIVSFSFPFQNCFLLFTFSLIFFLELHFTFYFFFTFLFRTAFYFLLFRITIFLSFYLCPIPCVYSNQQSTPFATIC